MERFAVLEFEEYPDDEVRVRLGPCPLSLYDEIVVKYITADVSRLPDDIKPMLDAWAPFLDSWSFPEPADRSGLDARDPALLLAIVRNWVQGVRQVPLPLPRKSSDGVPSETTETSPTSSTEPSSET